jgi:hypothetical protein
VRDTIELISASDVGELAAEFARKRAARAMAEVNNSTGWQVRIEWRSPASVTWPTFTYDTKPTREAAEYCARHSLQWITSGNDLSVVGACVRAPRASKWEPVSINEAATT